MEFVLLPDPDNDSAMMRTRSPNCCDSQTYACIGIAMNTLSTSNDKVRAVMMQRSALRQMTCERLLHLGMSQVVYLKSGICDGETLFMLYGADGIPIVATDNVDVAIEAAADRGLHFVNLH